MKYTVVLTEKPEGGIHVSVPALPNCTVEASTRDEALHRVREAIVETVSRSEIIHLDVPQQPRTVTPNKDVPWEWFGAAHDDPTWEVLFDDIERRREVTSNKSPRAMRGPLC
jgi:predicted RNase H-like HicB family nuclease